MSVAQLQRQDKSTGKERHTVFTSTSQARVGRGCQHQGAASKGRFTSFSASAYPIHTPRRHRGYTIRSTGIASCTPSTQSKASLRFGPLTMHEYSHILSQCLINVPPTRAYGCTPRQHYIAGLKLDFPHAHVQNEEPPHWRASPRHPRLHL